MRKTFIIAILLCVASSAVAATITVRKDGTGDRATIQLGLNIAADGDTLLIGPGEYTETTSVVPPGWSSSVASHGVISVRELTIIGAGEGLTVIGPAAYSWNGTYGPHGLTMTVMDHELHISDLTIRNCHSGLYFRGALTMERCELRNHDLGVNATLVGTENVIRNCLFSGEDPYPPTGISTVYASSSLQVEDCQFNGSMAYVRNSDVSFRRCHFRGGVVAIQVMDGAHGQLWDCDIADVSVGLTTYLGSPPSHCDIYNSRIAGAWEALLVDQRTSVTVEGSVLTGGSNAVVYASDPDALTIHGCDFQKGTGPVILSSRPAVWGAVTYDLTNNFWGTTDEATIRSWIIDYNDDRNIAATVTYSPYAGQSVPTETTTWGDLKATFR